MPKYENARLWYIAGMAINLRTVIAELQFILELSNDNAGDRRLPQLLAAAETDLATAARGILGADDPLINP